MNCFKVNGRPDLQTKHDALVSAGMDEFKAVRQILADEYKVVHDLVNAERAKHGLSPKEFTPLEEIKIESVPEPVVEQPIVDTKVPEVSAEKPTPLTKEESTKREKDTDQYIDAFEKANNANTNYIRENVLDMDPIKAEAIGVDDIIKEAQDRYITKNEGIQGKFSIEHGLVLDTMQGKLLSAPQVVAVANALNKMQMDHAVNSKYLEVATQNKNKKDIDSYTRIIDDLEDLMDHFTEALNHTGTETARALVIRSKVLFKNRMSSTAMRTSFAKKLATYGVELDDSKRQFIDDTAKRYDQLSKELNEARAKSTKSIEATKDLIANQEVSKMAKENILQKVVKRGNSLKDALASWDKVNSGKNC